MSRSRTIICLPLALMTDARLSSNAKIVYALLKNLAAGKSSASGHAPVVTAAHRELIDRSNLSQRTIVKSLRDLERAGWIEREHHLGFANRYRLYSSVAPPDRVSRCLVRPFKVE